MGNRSADSRTVHGHETFFDDPDSLLKVAASSAPQAVAWALVRAMREGKAPVIRAVGHGAVGQAVKAQIIARGLMANMALDLVFIPGFDQIENDQGEERNAIVWRVLWR